MILMKSAPKLDGHMLRKLMDVTSLQRWHSSKFDYGGIEGAGLATTNWQDWRPPYSHLNSTTSIYSVSRSLKINDSLAISWLGSLLLPYVI